MRPRQFIELSGYMVDVEAITCVGEARGAEADNPDTVIFLASGSTIYVSESVAKVMQLVHDAYVRAPAYRGADA